MIDPDAIEAIDVHVHAEVSASGHDPVPPELREASKRYFRGGGGQPTAEDVAAYYRERKMACVIFTVDWESQSGRAPVSNDEILEVAAANPDVLIPFAGVDPIAPTPPTRPAA